MTFRERYHYLALRGVVGKSTFGFERWMNQEFYASNDWKKARRQVIIRDNGCDLGIEDLDIHDRIYVHHMNPMLPSHIEHGNPDITNPEFLISCTLRTHNAIHFGDEGQLARPLVERTPGDTDLW